MHLLADKYFVILGGSRDQKPSVINAKELGFKTIVFDKDSNACCKNISDYFFNISSRDWKSIKKKLLKFKDQTYGVIAQGSDIPVIVSKIEGFLNIKNRSPLRSSKICSDKRLMKNFFIKHNIPTPKIFTTKKKIEDKDFPVIIKPINLSGSKGVYICKNKKELKQNLDLTKKVSRGVICEKFYEGPQLSTETLIINSKIYTYGFAERNYSVFKLSNFIKSFALVIEGLRIIPLNLNRFIDSHFSLLEIVRFCQNESKVCICICKIRFKLNSSAKEYFCFL